MYRHLKPDHVYPGFPAGDLDADQLTEAQRAILAALVAQGVYEVEQSDADNPTQYPAPTPEESTQADEPEAESG